MKKLLCLFLTLTVLAVCSFAFAGGNSKGTMMTDGNFRQTGETGWDTSKTISATVTGTKPAFTDVTVVSGTHQLAVTCVNPTTGAAAAGRVKINNAGTEIPVIGVGSPFVVRSDVTSLAFGKYSTATATDAVKCVAVGH